MGTKKFKERKMNLTSGGEEDECGNMSASVCHFILKGDDDASTIF